MAYRAIIFDLQGTLIRPAPRRAMYDSVMEMGHELGVDPIRFASLWFSHGTQRGTHPTSMPALPWIESNLETVCNDLGIELDALTRRRLAKMRQALILQTLKPQRGALKALTRMRGKGLKTAVIGDTPSEVPSLFHKTELAQHLDLSLLSCGAGYEQDDPRLFQQVLDGLGLPGELCIYVSARCDASLDAAAELDMRTIRFAPGLTEDGEPVSLCAHETRGTMLELTWLATGMRDLEAV